METLSLHPSPVPSPTSQHLPPLHQSSSSPASRPPSSRSHRSHPNFSLLPPLVTTAPSRTSHAHRPASRADKRSSLLSVTSDSLGRSRPHSTVFPAFHSSLAYTLVRDFAYTIDQSLHYGAPADSNTEASTPVSEYLTQYSQARTARGSVSEEFGGHDETHQRQSGPRLPATSFGHGPPWSEDEDLLSPIVTSLKHTRSRPNLEDQDKDKGRSRDRDRGTGGYGRRRSGAVLNPNDDDTVGLDEHAVHVSGGPTDYLTYGAARQGLAWEPSINHTHISPDAEGNFDEEASFASDDDPTPFSDEDGSATSRYSRDYQFTIASPDEEMHGKAVALFDFAKENENELPLLEGQVLWVSYRHGQGWLVAEDPKSGEKGLVPEDYIRLVRDIEGGLTRLNGGEQGDYEGSPVIDSPGVMAPSPMHERSWSGTSGRSGRQGRVGQQYPPVVSHFSTSSRDLERYPLAGSTAGQISPPAFPSPAVSPPPISPLAIASPAMFSPALLSPAISQPAISPPLSTPALPSATSSPAMTSGIVSASAVHPPVSGLDQSQQLQEQATILHHTLSSVQEEQEEKRTVEEGEGQELTWHSRQQSS